MVQMTRANSSLFRSDDKSTTRQLKFDNRPINYSKCTAHLKTDYYAEPTVVLSLHSPCLIIGNRHLHNLCV